MFYSQTFLAKKGPLGTVWCAAHLHHRLRKSQYMSTDISSTVDRIMFPEVPIALRMSGHLLLGVVRIYSKKVEYLVHDSNAILVGLRRAFARADINLPENASTAKPESVTLPPALDFDALEVDDIISSPERSPDNHLKSFDEITLPTLVQNQNNFIAITFDDDMVDVLGRDASPVDPPQEGLVAVENEINNLESTEPVTEVLDVHNEVRVEVLRSVQRDSRSDYLQSLEQEVLEGNNPVDVVPTIGLPLPPIVEDNLLPEQPTTPVRSANLTASAGSMDVFDIHLSLGKSPPEFAVRSSPPVERQPSPPAEARRRRKRKQFFDAEIVLKNKFVKKALEDTSDLLRKRKTVSSSPLWRSEKKMKTENIFCNSSLPGMTSDLCNLFEDRFLSSKLSQIPEPENVVIREDPSNLIPPSPVHEAELSVSATKTLEEQSTAFGTESLPSIERFRSATLNATLSEVDMSGFADTTANQTHTSFESESLGASTRSFVSDFGTFELSVHDRFDGDGRLPDIPELLDDMNNEEELNFLEADNTPQGSQGGSGTDALSVRTRAVAQYFSSKSPGSGSFYGCLTMNRIVEGRKRKICSRMFYETLVLKSYGMIDVLQEQPYGDIKIFVSPGLSKA